MLKKLFMMICFLSLNIAKLESFDKVVIWGHKLHTHTHSYIHNGFYIAFSYLGYPTYWLDNEDNVQDFDFSNTLFLTEGQVDDKIPLRDDCQYMIHNSSSRKYELLKPENVINFQVYTDDVLNRDHLVKLDHCLYYDLPGRCLYMPWATDLLPFEIDRIKQQLSKVAVEKSIYWIGTIGEGEFGNLSELSPFIRACEENNISFIQRSSVSVEENIKLIQQSYIAPSIVGKWQLKSGYIPCRIFKNLSYGKIGVTNSYRIYELFDKKIVYNPNPYQLFYDAERKLSNIKPGEKEELIEFVKNKHTYINRIHTLIDFLTLVNSTFKS